jgi:hypothetical protein
MSAPRYARLASKVLVVGEPPPAPQPSAASRAQAISAIDRAIAQRARARRRARWVGGLAAAAAVVAVGLGGVHYRAHRGAVASAPTPSTTSTPATSAAPAAVPTTEARVVGHAVAGTASVFSAGESAPLSGERPLRAGSRVVTARTARVLLAFSTGTSAVLDESGDVTLDSVDATEELRLDSGSIDLHVAKQSAGERFLVHTPDAEVEVRGTQFRVSIAPADAACGGGTTTRVAVSEGVVLVRHDGQEVRVGAGEQWPSGCTQTASLAPAVAARGSTGTGMTRAAPTPSSASMLGVQNDVFAEAVAAKSNGDTAGAIAGFDRFLARYPRSPLAESAAVERMRLLRTTDPAQAEAAAKAYLARYPRGFAHAEAQAILAASP